MRYVTASSIYFGSVQWLIFWKYLNPRYSISGSFTQFYNIFSSKIDNIFLFKFYIHDKESGSNLY